MISSKNNQNQGKDALKDSTKNQALENNIHKDVEDSNNPDDEAFEKKVLPDDATSDKSNQNINQGQDTLNDTNKNLEDKKSNDITSRK